LEKVPKTPGRAAGSLQVKVCNAGHMLGVTLGLRYGADGQKEVLMAMAQSFPIIENCLTCKFREQRLFCDLTREPLIKLQAIKTTSAYPKGAMLCLEGQAPRGVYVLCTGKAKLSTTSSEGKIIILRIAEPGEVLGLTAALSKTA
jgi:CRP-like cAMP-binding protein